MMADSTLDTRLEKAREACNRDPAFRKLGTCDARVGIKADDAAFIVSFEAFECTGTRKIGLDELRDADFTIDMPRAAWRDFLAGRRAGSGTSLVGRDVDTAGGIVRADNPLNALKFERYHLTLQHFFDKVAALS